MLIHCVMTDQLIQSSSVLKPRQTSFNYLMNKRVFRKKSPVYRATREIWAGSEGDSSDPNAARTSSKKWFDNAYSKVQNDNQKAPCHCNLSVAECQMTVMTHWSTVPVQNYIMIPKGFSPYTDRDAFLHIPNHVWRSILNHLSNIKYFNFQGTPKPAANTATAGRRCS